MSERQHGDDGSGQVAGVSDIRVPAKPRPLLRVWVVSIIVLLVNAGAFTWWAVQSSRDEARRAGEAASASAAVPVNDVTSSASPSVSATAPPGTALSPSTSPSTVTVSPGAVVVTPDPVPSVGNYAAWVFSARGVLDDYVATDGQMLTLGLTLCREVPVSLDRAEELSSGLGPALVGLTAGNVMDLSGVAERTICPGGAILPNPDTLPEPEPAALPSCPTMKQLKNTIRVVSSRKDPTSDYGARIWLVELRFTNPRPYPVYLNGELETTSESGGFLFSPSDSNYVQDLHGLKLKPGRSTIRTEVSNADSRLGAIGWDYWAIAPTEHVTDPDARCEQSAST